MLKMKAAKSKEYENILLHKHLLSWEQVVFI